MDQIMDTQFQRIETALNTLIDSISAYNPSPSAALDLVAADDGLSTSLDLLFAHQKNYARILSLRQQSENLDNQIKADVTLLANTRKELLATPATAFPADARDVAYKDVLSYARRISKFTVPPTLRPAPSTSDFEEAKDRRIDQSREDKPGASSPPASSPVDNAEVKQTKDGNEGIALSSLPAEHKQWLNPATGIPFVPWPSDDVIRRGGLAQIQSMLEQGVDPATASVEAQQVAEEKVRADEEERANVARDEEGKRTKQSVMASGRSAHREVEGPKVFGGLDLFDPEAEEEE